MRTLAKFIWSNNMNMRLFLLLAVSAFFGIASMFLWYTSAQIQDATERKAGPAKTRFVESPAAINVSSLTTQSPTAMVQRIIGNNTPFSNVIYTGAQGASGSFSGGTGIIGFEDGILLTSGSVQNVVGPNVLSNATFVNNVPGDASLNAIVANTRDASVLQFDFVPSANTVTFQYVFASEEYNEFANSNFNDVFAFFLNGTNVALIPGTSVPVSINTINGGNPLGTNAQRPQFFRNNAFPAATIDTEMDGLTTVLTVTGTVTPNVNNRIKLAIADVQDSSFDSAVFIRGSSFIVTPPAGAFVLDASNYNIAEGNAGSTNQTVTVNRIGGTAGAVSVSYATSNQTATGGAACGGNVDFLQRVGTLAFAAGQTSQTFTIPICGDTTSEANETIAVTLSAPTGGATLASPNTGTITIVDDESAPATVTVTVSPSSVQEDGPLNLRYVFVRTGSLVNPLDVNITALNSTAMFAIDYAQTGISGNFGGGAGTVTFNALSDNAIVIIDPRADTGDENDESVDLRLVSGAGYTPGNPASARGIIMDDDPSLTTTTITSDNPDPSTVGQVVEVRYSVIPAPPASGTPTGNVTVTASGGTETCTGTVAAGMCNITLTSPGARTLTATYTGNLVSSNDTEAHQVDAGTSVCDPIGIGFGQTFNGMWDGQSCNIQGFITDIYSFNGTAGDQIVIGLRSDNTDTRIELLNPAGTVIASTLPGSVRDSRLPAENFFPLPVTGTYMIRASGPFALGPGRVENPAGGLGTYTINLFKQQTQACNYLVSPSETDVTPAGGTFFFDVTTAPGCPPLPAPSPSGPIHTIVSYISGRVTFTVPPNPNPSVRTGTIAVGGLNHAISQFGTNRPPNDDFASAQLISGSSNRPGGDAPETVAGDPIAGFNSTASAEPNSGEPVPVADTQTPAKSIWYRWFAPDGAFYSFSTSGSSFDTVMGIYLCPTGLACALSTLVPVGANDDTTTFDRSSKVNFRSIAGREYRIVIDGKNGASGTSQLSWMRFQRLFRLYLQNFNGLPANITPNTVRAVAPGVPTVDASRLSQGVYEFNIPANNAAYTVNIDGPSGILWDPNNFPLESLARPGGAATCAPTVSGQNNTSNPIFAAEDYLQGWVRNIRAADLPDDRFPNEFTPFCPEGRACIQVSSGYSAGGSSSHRSPEACRFIGTRRRNGEDYVQFQCRARPEVLQSLLPNMPGREFDDPFQAFTSLIPASLNVDIADSRFAAATKPTFDILGSAGNQPCTTVELAYAPVRGAADIVLRENTGAAGAYRFRNLVPLYPDLTPIPYKVKAIRQGAMFPGDREVLITNNQNVTLDIAKLVPCEYEERDVPAVPSEGGQHDFRILTSSTCEVEVTANDPWITINASDTIGGQGRVLFTTQPNRDPGPRTGTFTVEGRTTPITITQAGGFIDSVEGDLAGRPSGNRVLNTADSAQFKRFIGGLDEDFPLGNEYQRTDVAPKEMLGDGRLDAADQQQINNYIATLDEPRNAGGPTGPQSVRTAKSSESASEAASRVYRVVTTPRDWRGFINAAVELDARGNETAMSFSLNFDPTRLAIAGVSGTSINSDVTLGADAVPGSSITINAKQSARGVVGVLIDGGRSLASGTKRIVNLRFRVLKDGGTDPTFITFSDDSISRGTTNAAAELLGARYENGEVLLAGSFGAATLVPVPFDSIFVDKSLYREWAFTLH